MEEEGGESKMGERREGTPPPLGRRQSPCPPSSVVWRRHGCPAVGVPLVSRRCPVGVPSVSRRFPRRPPFSPFNFLTLKRGARLLNEPRPLLFHPRRLRAAVYLPDGLVGVFNEYHVIGSNVRNRVCVCSRWKKRVARFRKHCFNGEWTPRTADVFRIRARPRVECPPLRGLGIAPHLTPLPSTIHSRTALAPHLTSHMLFITN